MRKENSNAGEKNIWGEEKLKSGYYKGKCQHMAAEAVVQIGELLGSQEKWFV